MRNEEENRKKYKYSDGRSGQRYYGGNEYVEQARALALYSLDPEQTYSGSSDNVAVFTGVVDSHDWIMGFKLPDGGHLTHGFYTAKTKVSRAGTLFRI